VVTLASIYNRNLIMNSRNPIILCVDDEKANLDLLESILVYSDYKVVGALNGIDALLKIKSQTVDLVLLDINMPGMDGFEVCRQIKEDSKLSDIPIIMVTALASPEDYVRGIEVGAEDYFTKPFKSAELLARIKILLKVKKLNDARKHAEEALQKSHDTL
jgi:DNA-binding response OmpR family regulator